MNSHSSRKIATIFQRCRLEKVREGQNSKVFSAIVETGLEVKLTLFKFRVYISKRFPKSQAIKWLTPLREEK